MQISAWIGDWSYNAYCVRRGTPHSMVDNIAPDCQHSILQKNQHSIESSANDKGHVKRKWNADRKACLWFSISTIRRRYVIVLIRQHQIKKKYVHIRYTTVSH